MRIVGGLALTVLGVAALVFGAVETVLASTGHCKGTVVVTGGGSGGGIICANVNCSSACKIGQVTSPTTGNTYKWCYCDGGPSPPECCFIFWVLYPDGTHGASRGGSCQVAEDPCPLPGTCTKVQNGSQFTAECQ